MERKNKNLLRIFGHGIISGFVILIIGCITISDHTAPDIIQPQTSATKPVTIQIIIKFRVDSLDPSPPAFIEQLSRDAAATLVYWRPMSGGAHVFGLKDIGDAVRIKEIIRRLKERPDILYVEKNALMQHRKGKRQY